jgi:hypothetical protein
MTADDHGSVYSSPTSGSSSDSAAQTIAFGLKLFFVSLPAMGQHALNIHSWEHSCLNRICQQKQKLSVSNSPQAQWNALSYLSQALDEMGPIVYTFAISISCFVGSIAIWLAYGSFEDAPAEYWYSIFTILVIVKDFLQHQAHFYVSTLLTSSMLLLLQSGTNFSVSSPRLGSSGSSTLRACSSILPPVPLQF